MSEVDDGECSECGHPGGGHYLGCRVHHRIALEEIDRLRAALEPFAAEVVGGTAAADKLKVMIVYMLEHNKPGDGVDVIYQFTAACLNARAALKTT